jgi:hypothetical protein
LKVVIQGRKKYELPTNLNLAGKPYERPPLLEAATTTSPECHQNQNIAFQSKRFNEYIHSKIVGNQPGGTLVEETLHTTAVVL